jgi:hypothetical protein
MIHYPLDNVCAEDTNFGENVILQDVAAESNTFLLGKLNWFGHSVKGTRAFFIYIIPHLPRTVARANIRVLVHELEHTDKGVRDKLIIISEVEGVFAASMVKGRHHVGLRAYVPLLADVAYLGMIVPEIGDNLRCVIC